jgi:hypothetical protein
MATPWLAALLLAAVAATVESPLPLGELPPQQLAKDRCALVLWERSTRRRVAMAEINPGSMRVLSGGVVATLTEASADGERVIGFAPRARYGVAGLQVETSLAIVANDAAAGGAIVRDGVITVTGSDGVAVVAPVAGIIGCGG